MKKKLTILTVFALMLFVGTASADTLFIGFEVAESYTAGTSIDGQPGTGNDWFVATLSPPYDEEVTSAGAHSGAQSLRWSNTVFSGIVDALRSPSLSVPAGETGSVAGDGTPAAAGFNLFVQDFWFRTVSTSADAGLEVNQTIDDAAGRRMTAVFIFEDSGSLDVGYFEYKTGTGFVFKNVVLGLSWGTWYHVRVELEFVDGVDNDVVKVFLGTSNVLTAADLKLTANSWEDFYRDAYSQPSPAVVGSLSRINGNPGVNTPAGIYLDDLTMTSTGTTLYSCVGFEPPMDIGAVTVKKNMVLPLKAELLDFGGNPITDADIPAPPVIQVIFTPTAGPAEDVSDEALSAGFGTAGNQFEFRDGKWQFNLKTKNYSGSGTYTVTMVSGDLDEYTIDPTCTATFVIN